MQFRIHGDNIVECQRTFDLIVQSLDVKPCDVNGPLRSALCPRFVIPHPASRAPMTFTMLPGFGDGRWDENVLNHLRASGGLLREAPDSIVCRLENNVETPLFALEYCGALPAGNQAWQRSGRAYSLAKASVPYLYVAEIGGYELDSKRKKKAARLPNPAVPFSYLCTSLETSQCCLPVYLWSPAASLESRAMFSSVIGEKELIQFIRAHLLATSPTSYQKVLERKTMSFVSTLAKGRRGSDSLSSPEWDSAYKALSSGISLSEHLLQSARIDWSKTAYIKNLTSTAKLLMNVASKYATGLTSSNLPICLLARNERPAFAAAVGNTYANLTPSDLRFLGDTKAELAIAWVMGFKPRGDDARPDRGLPPLARMLAGANCEILTVVYGPAPASHWRQLAKAPGQLAESNGLWESVMAVSDAVLVDSSTTPRKSRRLYLSSHWHQKLQIQRRPEPVTPSPRNIGEQDVDTVVHITLANLGKKHVFECMCNPPGGDWSGISILDQQRSNEFRWLSLPRVSATRAKRPDHVFQVFGCNAQPTLLSVESKELGRAVEQNVGPALKRYLSDLFVSPPSAYRSFPAGDWTQYGGAKLQLVWPSLSMVAFVGGAGEDLKGIGLRASADIVCSFSFDVSRGASEMYLTAMTPKAVPMVNFLASLQSLALPIEIKVV